MIPRSEFPNPQMQRANWLCLNGPWRFAFDDEDRGLKARWQDAPDALTRTITVPFAHQAPLSGIGETGRHEVVWYHRTFDLPEAMRGQRVFLHFGAVDYEARVWVNGQQVALHLGGHTSFSCEITHCVMDRGNTVAVRAFDPVDDLTIPRGKQYWKERGESIFYTRTTGIWQSVWLEATGAVRLQSLSFAPDIRDHSVRVDYALDGGTQAALALTVRFAGREVAMHRVEAASGKGRFALQLAVPGVWNWEEEVMWSPEHPHLFEVTAAVYDSGAESDRVESYFGLRDVAVVDGWFRLNDRPVRQRLALDQGYWPDGLMTAPDDAAFERDLMLVREMGFHGIRVHQKIEDPRFLYWADRLGVLVWEEMPSCYAFDGDAACRLMREWAEAIRRDISHPSIVVWTPMNESWGVPGIGRNRDEQALANAMVSLTRALDPTRPVVSNDGWEHTAGDLLTIHDYSGDANQLRARYQSLPSIFAAEPAGRPYYAGSYRYQDEPVLLTEYGGICLKADDANGWGYSSATTAEDLAARLQAVVDAVYSSPVLKGFCYTQLYDVEQETNGLLAFDRTPKLPLEVIRRIMDRDGCA